jgi:flavin-dependent dehydrogenase
VFTSPVTVRALKRLGLGDAEVAAVARPVPAMRVETPTGTRFRLTYGDDGSLAAPAVGLDRSRLDPLLLDLASRAGADTRGRDVRRVDGRRVIVGEGAGTHVIEAGLVVGADGIRSIVARANGVAGGTPLGSRTGLTFHVEEPAGAGIDAPRDARMIVFDGGYVGLAPVPGGRVNVGIVLGGRGWAEGLRRDGAAASSSRLPRPAATLTTRYLERRPALRPDRGAA